MPRAPLDPHPVTIIHAWSEPTVAAPGCLHMYMYFTREAEKADTETALDKKSGAPPDVTSYRGERGPGFATLYERVLGGVCVSHGQVPLP